MGNSKNDATSFFDTWMKSATGFWTDMAKTGMNQGNPFGMPPFPGMNATQNTQGPAEEWNRIFQAFSSAFIRPESMGKTSEASGYSPDFFSQITEQAWAGYLEIQKQWIAQTAEIRDKVQKYNFDELEPEYFKLIRDIYEKEFQKYFNVPSLGLNRFYQERISRVMDKHNLFQTAFNEFLYVFHMPLKKAAAVMQKKAEEMAEKGEYFTDFKEYYNQWVKELESQYMALLKTSEYTQIMDDTIGAWVSYKEAREELLYDLLKQLPIPTNREMDELYKDFHHLKKQVRELSKELKKVSGK